MTSRCFALAALLALGAASLGAEDWPEFRGKGRRGLWNESGILETFPETGLNVLWRTPVAAGYAGPAVADGRVFVADARRAGPRVTERALALDAKTGGILWTYEWETDYRGLLDTWATGPRATPTVDGDRVYVLGASGVLVCLNVKTGAVVWRKDYRKDYGTELPPWGMTGAPLVDGERVICLVGGQNNAKVVAFDKMTGREIWRALPSDDSEPGYGQPIIVEAGGTRQLILWHPLAVASLDPVTGKVHWQQPFKSTYSMTVATPVQAGPLLLVSAFYNGSMMLVLDGKKPTSTVLWKGTSNSEIQTDGLHALITTPVIDGEYVYGICSYGQMRGLNAKTGERVWETQAVTGERARWAAAQIIRNRDRYFINNDRGDLIIARFAADGYHEISRTHLIKPTSVPSNRRELVHVNWMAPAYANKSIYARNDEEILCASLAAGERR